VAGRTLKTEAIVLRSFRFGEADRVLHVYTSERGRVGAVAKGIRRTKSRFGARLEPLSHVELLLHLGSGELATVTGANLIEPHRATREEPYRLGVGLVGAEAMLRLFSEQEANPRAFAALVRFLEVTDTIVSRAPSHPGLDPVSLAFQLKLLWLSGYQPHMESCAECGVEGPLAGYLPQAGGAVCPACAEGSIPLSAGGFAAIDALLKRPLAEAVGVALGERAARETLAVVAATHEYHGGFRLRTLSA
jgi:DNA repair protein RecO (recombination protein O)